MTKIMREPTEIVSDLGPVDIFDAVTHARFSCPAVHTDTLLWRSVRWLIPWTKWTFPGLDRGSVRLMPRNVSMWTVRSWRTGHRALPVDIAEGMLDHIRSRCFSGQLLIQELEDYIKAQRAKPKRLMGCCEMDEFTGLPKRGRRKK